MTSSWDTKECHFTWNLKEIPKVRETADELLRKIKNNLAETDFLKIEHLLFRACLQLWFKKNVIEARESLDEANREIEKHRSEGVYKGYKSVELLNRMWIENNMCDSERVRESHKELATIELEEKDLQVVGAIKAAALMRLGPVMFDTTLKLFKAAHQACPSNPDFLFGFAHITGQKMRFMRTEGSRYNENMDQFVRDLMDEEKEYWKRLIDMEPNHQGYHFANSMLGLNLSRRDGPEDTERALRLLEEAYKDAPDIHEVCRNLIRFLRDTHPGDLDRCITILESSISKQPARVENHHQLAMCYVKYAKKKKKRRGVAKEWTIKALEELDECLRLDSLHVYALLNKAKQLQHLHPPTNGETTSDQNKIPQNIYENMILKSTDFPPDDKLRLHSDFASFLQKNETASSYKRRIDIWQKVMNMSTDESFEHQNESGKWETKKKHKFSKNEAYVALKEHYESQKDHLKLGILFYQNFEFDDAIKTLGTVGQTHAEVPYYLAKTFLKRGQEKIIGDLPKPEEAAEDFTRARKNVDLARGLGLEPQKVREILADTALAIAHDELQVNVRYGGDLEDHPETSIIGLEDRCVTSYREAVRCGSLVAGMELMKLVERDFIKVTSRSKFIQILAEIEVCCSQPQSDMLHAESKPLTFEKGLRCQETDVEPSMLSNRKKIKEDIKLILKKDMFFHNAWKGLFHLEVLLLEERFKGTDGLQLDGREEAPLEDVNEDVINKAVACCWETRPLLDRIMEKFQKDELHMTKVKKNYFPLILDQTMTTEEAEESLREKLKILKIDLETHYPKLFEYLRKLQPKISAENCFLENFVTFVNKTKHSNEDALDIEQDPVNLARQSTDKAEEICNAFFDTMKEAKWLRTRVEELVSAIESWQSAWRAGKVHGGTRRLVTPAEGSAEDDLNIEKVDIKADQLLKILKENEDFVVRLDNTWTFLGMLALIRHCRETADTDLTEVTELSKRNSEFSKELRKCYLEVEAALLANGGDQSSMEVLKKCHMTCIEADKLLNKSLQSEGCPKEPFPFPNEHPGDDKTPWIGQVKRKLKKHLKAQGISDNGKLLDIILEAQPCSNEDNYHFIAMRRFLDFWSRGYTPKTVSKEKEANSSVPYDVLELTRWCVNNAEKVASEVMAEVQSAPTSKKAKRTK